MGYRHLLVRREGPVAFLTLNRPEVRNAFNDEVIAELTACAADIRESPEVRVAVLAGAGTHFCAGADIAWMQQMRHATETENREDALRMAAMFGALDTLPVPLVARIQGAAIAGGTGLASVCDIVVAAEDAVFGFTEVRLGIVPAVISPFALAKIGIGAARELFLTGARFSATRARELGLVHEIVPEEALDLAVGRYVKELMSAAPGAISRIKALIRTVAGRPPAEVASLTAETIARQRVSPEGQEGLTAFLDKRAPTWTT
jgi:methylglutaconyl-CoA hydratase